MAILCRKFTVQELSTADSIIAADHGRIGYINFTTQVIQISGLLPRDQQWEVLMHELIHAADAATMQGDEAHLSEAEVHRMGIALLTIFRNNKLRFDW